MISNPGMLNKRIDIVKPGTVDDEGWDVMDDTVIYSRIRAAIYPMRGKEVLEDDRYKSELPLRIVIYYRPNVDTTCEVMYQNNRYEITSIIDPNMEHESLEMFCLQKSRGEADDS